MPQMSLLSTDTQSDMHLSGHFSKVILKSVFFVLQPTPKHIKDSIELRQRIKDLESKLKEKDKEIERQAKRIREEQEKIEILKKSLHIFMQTPE